MMVAMDQHSAHPEVDEPIIVYTVGHSNHSLERFLDLLMAHGIAALADVRTAPFSRFSPQFNRDHLKRVLREAHVEYVFLGRELGGRPTGDEFYDDEGHVRYDRLAESPLFLEGIRRLVEGAQGRRVTMMCSEADPAQCHRHLLIAHVLNDLGVRVEHIESDGSTSSYSMVAQRTPIQEVLFDEERTQWRSPRSVLRDTAPSHSSDD